MGLLQMGNIFIDGTKVQASASRRQAVSYEYMKKLEAEIDKLLELGISQDEQEKQVQFDILQELTRRKERLEKIRQAGGACRRAVCAGETGI